MQSVGAFDAKTHFSQLLLKVEQGQSFIITKHGNEVAMLVPIHPVSEKSNVTLEAIQSIRRLRKGVTLGVDLNVKILREEGRK
jgi:prevent-host-death family protein